METKHQVLAYGFLAVQLGFCEGRGDGFFRHFYERGHFMKSLNVTFFVLIPKKRGAEDLKGFRPINLVGGLYKLLAKVLANRIKKVVGKVVLKKMIGEKWRL